MTRALAAAALLLLTLVLTARGEALSAGQAIDLFTAAPAPIAMDRKHLGVPLRSFNLQVVDRLAAVHARGGYRAAPGDRTVLLAAMNDPKRDPYAQLCAARYLLDLDDVHARQRVVDCLDGSDPRLLHNAAAVLRMHVDRDARQRWGIEQMLRLLADDRLLMGHEPTGGDSSGDAFDDHSETFDEICWDLGSMRLGEAAEALIAVVRRRPEVNGAAVALGLIGDAAAQDALLATLVDDQGRLRPGQARALGMLKATAAVTPLLEQLGRRYDDGTRFHERPALEALGQIGDPRAAEPVRRYLDDAGAPYRSEARLALALITSPDPGADLVELLRHESQRAGQGRLIAALRRHGGPTTAAPLAALLTSSDDPWLRAQGIVLLGEWGGDAAVDALIAMLEQPDRTLSADGGATQWSQRELIADALRAATGQTLGTDAGAWRRWRGR